MSYKHGKMHFNISKKFDYNIYAHDKKYDFHAINDTQEKNNQIGWIMTLQVLV